MQKLWCLTMADKKQRLAENVEGNFYVDSSCYNCGLSRRYAPMIFGDTGSHAFVKSQPRTDAEMLATKQALLVCPAGSIGTLESTELKSAMKTFPIRLADDVYLTGFNSRKSYGADSYFIRSASGNWLVDSPRYTKHLVDVFKQAGGLKYIFLTHRDDVADAHKYAAYFSAKRIIHRNERQAQPNAEIILDGEQDHEIDKAVIVFTPGHTTGHLVLLWDNHYLFTGDHLSWHPSVDGLGSFNRYSWHWPLQIQSVEKLARYSQVEWIFPGHGKRKQVPMGVFPSMIATAVARMKSETGV